MNRIKKVITNIMADLLNIDEILLSQLDGNEDITAYGLNSILAMQMVVLLEEEYNIEFEEDNLILDNINTINKIQKIVDNLI